MGPEHFEFLSTLLKARTGLTVTPDKMYLLETRLLPVARRQGCKALDELVDLYRDGQDEAVAVAICEAMSTHESLFFRNQKPFDLFRAQIVPELLKRRSKDKVFRVWCAACSSGQEPYSLAMILDDLRDQMQGWRAEIFATDISNSVLKRAEEGLFSQFEVQRGLPVQLLVQHFTQEGEDWRLSKRIRDMVRFQPFNLLSDPKPLGRFDVVFCRNVLIYFDLATKSGVLDGLADILADDGVLFLGSAESTIGITEKFWPVEAGRGVYKHTGGPASLVEAN